LGSFLGSFDISRLRVLFDNNEVTFTEDCLQRNIDEYINGLVENPSSVDSWNILGETLGFARANDTQSSRLLEAVSRADISKWSESVSLKATISILFGQARHFPAELQVFETKFRELAAHLQTSHLINTNTISEILANAAFLLAHAQPNRIARARAFGDLTVQAGTIAPRCAAYFRQQMSRLLCLQDDDIQHATIKSLIELRCLS